MEQRTFVFIGRKVKSSSEEEREIVDILCLDDTDCRYDPWYFNNGKEYLSNPCCDDIYFVKYKIHEFYTKNEICVVSEIPEFESTPEDPVGLCIVSFNVDSR